MCSTQGACWHSNAGALRTKAPSLSTGLNPSQLLRKKRTAWIRSPLLKFLLGKLLNSTGIVRSTYPGHARFPKKF
jgi:hypothetical protein